MPVFGFIVLLACSRTALLSGYQNLCSEIWLSTLLERVHVEPSVAQSCDSCMLRSVFSSYSLATDAGSGCVSFALMSLVSWSWASSVQPHTQAYRAIHIDSGGSLFSHLPPTLCHSLTRKEAMGNVTKVRSITNCTQQGRGYTTLSRKIYDKGLTVTFTKVPSKEQQWNSSRCPLVGSEGKVIRRGLCFHFEVLYELEWHDLVVISLLVNTHHMHLFILILMPL